MALSARTSRNSSATCRRRAWVMSACMRPRPRPMPRANGATAMVWMSPWPLSAGARESGASAVALLGVLLLVVDGDEVAVTRRGLAAHGLLRPRVAHERRAFESHDGVEVVDLRTPHEQRSSQHLLAGGRGDVGGTQVERHVVGEREAAANASSASMPTRRRSSRASSRVPGFTGTSSCGCSAGPPTHDGEVVVIEAVVVGDRELAPSRVGDDLQSASTCPRGTTHATASWLATSTNGRPIPTAKACAAAMPTRRPMKGRGHPARDTRQIVRPHARLGERVADESAHDLRVPHGVVGARLGQDAAVARSTTATLVPVEVSIARSMDPAYWAAWNGVPAQRGP